MTKDVALEMLYHVRADELSLRLQLQIVVECTVSTMRGQHGVRGLLACIHSVKKRSQRHQLLRISLQ